MKLIELTDAPCNAQLEVKTLGGGFNWEKRFESMGKRAEKLGRLYASPLADQW
jgi:hypothetical protein